MTIFTDGAMPTVHARKIVEIRRVKKGGKDLKTRIQATRAKFLIHTQFVAAEAASLLRRRKLSYAVLAVMLAAGSVYISSLQPVAAPDNNPSSHRDNKAGALTQDSIAPPEAMQQPGSNNPSAQHDASNSSIQSETSVTVNGEDIPIPQNGELHRVTTGDGNTTSVSISHNASGDNSYSSLHVDVSSQSTAGQEGN